MHARIDLHTHSIASPDGSITLVDYSEILKTKVLDFIAITDHDRVDFALYAQKQLGDQIIVGEEITTSEDVIVENIFESLYEYNSSQALIHTVSLANKLNLNFEHCLNSAWQVIKDRKGKTVDGTFIKNS